MGSRITSTELLFQRRRTGYTLVEVLIMLPLSALCPGVLLGVSFFAARSFHALINYSELSGKNRHAANVMISEIRQANRVASCSTNALVLVDSDGASITYTYDAGAGTLTRLKNGVSKVLLTGCDQLNFDLGERNPVEGTYDVYPAATAATAKVIDISWRCSRTIMGVKQNSESVQTARVVIRKQGT